MDNQDQADPTLRFWLTARCVREEDQKRLAEEHGFSLSMEKSQYHYERHMDGTWSDVHTYVQTLRGLPGVTNVSMMMDRQVEEEKKLPAGVSYGPDIQGGDDD